MKHLFKTGLLFLVVGFFISFISCADDEPQPENFATLEDAQTALDETSEDIFSAIDVLPAITNVALTFDGSNPNDDIGFKIRRSKTLSKKYSPGSFGYNTQTGFWNFDTTKSGEGVTFSYKGKIRFTPHDILGLPNESTNTMEYDANLSINDTEGNGYIDYNTGVNLTGISDFRATTGNATLNGSTGMDFMLDGTFDDSHISLKIKHVYKINEIILSPTSDYPQSGTFTFTIKRDINATGFGANFYVAGTITFDGTNIAILEFGGYTFHINLDYEMYIVEFV